MKKLIAAILLVITLGTVFLMASCGTKLEPYGQKWFGDNEIEEVKEPDNKNIFIVKEVYSDCIICSLETGKSTYRFLCMSNESQSIKAGDKLVITYYDMRHEKLSLKYEAVLTNIMKAKDE